MRAKVAKPVPHAFVLEALFEAKPRTNPMFGCLAVYVRAKIVLILRDKANSEDNGVWLATTADHHESLRADFPNMRSIKALGGGEKATGWQNLSAEASDFEESVMRACEFILAGDPRIGKIPAQKRRK